MSRHGVRETEREGLRAVELSSPRGLAACYVPGAGMVCGSLRHRGEELLGQREGLRAYAASGSTMGIPLLHPWANRLGRRGYAIGDVRVAFPDASPLVHSDPNGLPIHGLLAGCPDWEVLEQGAGAQSARLVAQLDLARRPDVLELFPFLHVVHMEVELAGPALSVETTLRATGDVAVPIAFGYHPYFRLPGVPREEWEVHLPVRRRAVLDERCLPTGRTEAVRIPPDPLGDRVYDDLFPELEPEPTFLLAGGGRRIRVEFTEGYRVAVVYAPANDDVVCFEPMTAPTNPFEGGAELVRVAPGEAYTATFHISVT